jgi:hypothetical protein
MKESKIKIPYANTGISKEKTKAEISEMLDKYGIQDIQWTTYHGETSLKFAWNLTVKGVERELIFQFIPAIISTKKRVWSNTDQRTVKADVQLENTSYRLLFNYLKNKLEAVRWGLESMEKEFLSHVVVSLPNGEQTTVGENITKIFETVSSPALSYTPEPIKQDIKIVDIQ